MTTNAKRPAAAGEGGAGHGLRWVVELGDLVVGEGYTKAEAWHDARRAATVLPDLDVETCKAREIDLTTHQVVLDGGIVCVVRRR